MQRKIITILLLITTMIAVLFFSIIVTPTNLHALEKTTGIKCNGRYVTLVNPVRGRDTWYDKSINPLRNQHNEIVKRDFAATWLFQYDALLDAEITRLAESFLSNQEKGLFVEISRNLAENAKIPYDETVSWFSPKMIFLSAYSPLQREKLIDEMMSVFKFKFGDYPKSVGAWWIDSYSLNYMKNKYKIKTALIVADQKLTDDYGIWGQWWGYPYIASKANILTPAKDRKQSSDVVVIQWAQRDPEKAYGEEGYLSLYSLQANDYLKLGYDTGYYSTLVNKYLSCENILGQITLGLETGKESIEAWPEYLNQLTFISRNPDIKTMTMSEFSDVYKANPPDQVLIGDKDKLWELSTDKRENKYLNERINYTPGISFSDYFIADESRFLRRNLNDLVNQNPAKWFYWWIVGLPSIYLLLKKRSDEKIFFPYLIFLISSFGLILFSYQKFGWQIFLGPKVDNLVFWQLSITILSFIPYYYSGDLFFKNNKVRNYYYFIVPLTYGIDFFVSLLRYSFISGVHYFGLIVDITRFVGFAFNSGLGRFDIYNLTFPINQANAFLKFPFEKLQQNLLLWVILLPTLHLLVSYFTTRLITVVGYKIKIVILAVLSLLFLGFLIMQINTEPQYVVPLYIN